VLIEGTGTIIVKGWALDGEESVLTLTNTLYVLTFHTNIVSLTRAIAWGVHWNMENIYLTKNGKPLCALAHQYGQ
jgi:hypothetical protein